MIDPFDLQGVDQSQRYFRAQGVGFFAGVAEGDTSCFYAGVDLPQGAKLVGITSYLQSRNFGDPYFSLTRHSFADSAALKIVQDTRLVDNSGELRGVTGRAAPNSVVNNRFYTYTYEVCLATGDGLKAARVEYQYGNAGD